VEVCAWIYLDVSISVVAMHTPAPLVHVCHVCSCLSSPYLYVLKTGTEAPSTTPVLMLAPLLARMCCQKCSYAGSPRAAKHTLLSHLFGGDHRLLPSLCHSIMRLFEHWTKERTTR
jgi:hypothetical protein